MSAAFLLAKCFGIETGWAWCWNMLWGLVNIRFLITYLLGLVQACTAKKDKKLTSQQAMFETAQVIFFLPFFKSAHWLLGPISAVFYFLNKRNRGTRGQFVCHFADELAYCLSLFLWKLLTKPETARPLHENTGAGAEYILVVWWQWKNNYSFKLDNVETIKLLSY
jgi:uncharacterized membrane protein